MRASSAPARPRRHGLSILAKFAPVVVGLLLGAAPASAADPTRPAAPSESDAALAVRAKAALAADRELAGLSLMVSVMNRIAVVGGPVPDADATERIRAVLRKVPGLTDAKVSCWVPTADDPLTKLVGERLKAAAGWPGPLPVVVAPRPDPEPPAAGPPLTVAVRPPDEAADRRAPGAVTVQRIPVASAVTGFLLDPVAPGGRPVSTLPMPSPAAAYPTIPPPAVPTAPGSVAAGLAALRANDPRFAGLTVDLKAGAAVIAGRAARSADAWDFADAVRKLPGVDRVIVGPVDVQ